jgi:hypothetical protein
MGYLSFCETITVVIVVIAVHYSWQLPFNTGDMAAEPTRSEEVISDFKQRKLARSALRRIQELIQGFEKDHAFDRQLALIGVIAVVLLVAVSLYFLFSGDSITLR